MTTKDALTKLANRQRIIDAVISAPDGHTVTEIAEIVSLSDYSVRRHLALMDRAAVGIALVGKAASARYCAVERAEEVAAKLKRREILKTKESWRTLKAAGREEELRERKERNAESHLARHRKAYFGDKVIRPAAGLDPVETTAPNSIFAFGMSLASQPEE